MTPLATGVILACVVALTIVLVSEIETLTGELQKLSRNANDNLQRIGGIVDRVEDISVQVARVVGAVGGLTRIGQYAGMAAGVKRGVEVFIHRLKERHH